MILYEKWEYKEKEGEKWGKNFLCTPAHVEKASFEKRVVGKNNYFWNYPLIFNLEFHLHAF